MMRLLSSIGPLPAGTARKGEPPHGVMVRRLEADRDMPA
jgi:hypothetical protein